MTHATCRYLCMLGLAAAGWVCFGGSTAEAVVGAPATPVSYAGVARRSTVEVGAPGVGATPTPGVGAPGVGATPTPGVGAPGVGATPTPGVGANAGGPANRVGVR
jgi:hypothetical protein